MAKFHSLPVVNKRQETPDAISISFSVPDHLKTEYAYKPGQYLTLRLNINGEEVRRAYSLCSSPFEDEVLTVTVKRVAGGKMSNWLNDNLQLGLSIEVMIPEGRFVPQLDPNQSVHYVLIAGGSGITPMMSIIRSVLKMEPQSRVSLVYANRNPQSIIFKSALEELEQKNPGRLVQYHLVDETGGTDWKGGIGPVTADKMETIFREKLGSDKQANFFVCGPGPMMDAVIEGLNRAGVSDAQIIREYFTNPSSDEKKEVRTETALPEKGSKVFVTLYGKEYELFIDDNTTILQAGVKAGIDPPFSCEAGICSTCMAKVLEGKAVMDENNILTKDEVEQGFILTCQAHPVTPIVRLEYYD